MSRAPVIAVTLALALALYGAVVVSVHQAVSRLVRITHGAVPGQPAGPRTATARGPERPTGVLAWSLIAATACFWLPILTVVLGLTTGALGPHVAQADPPSAAEAGMDARDRHRQAALPYEAMRLDACRTDLRSLQADLEQSTAMTLQFIAAPQKAPPAFRAYKPLGELFVAAKTRAMQCLQMDFPETVLAVSESRMNMPAPGEPTDNLSQMYRYRKFYRQASQTKAALADFLATIGLRKAMLRRELAD